MPTACRPFLALLLATILAGCAEVRFYPHESRENIYQGKGGSRFTVDGLDVWFNGEPSHRYAILGYIEDSRGLVADERHRSLDSGVLRKAREIGADALIETPVPGRATRASSGFVFGGGRGGFGLGFGMGIPEPEPAFVKYTAVRYLD